MSINMVNKGRIINNFFLIFLIVRYLIFLKNLSASLTQSRVHNMTHQKNIDPSDLCVNPTVGQGKVIALNDLIENAFSRRAFVQGGAMGALMSLVGGCSVASPKATANQNREKSEFDFEPLTHGVDENIHVPKGYSTDILISWGESFVDDTVFDPLTQTAELQEKRFGFNNDYIGLVPLPMGADGNFTKGLLCVNHEYAIEKMMFPQGNNLYSDEQKKNIMMSSLGNSILEVEKKGDVWKVVKGSVFNRRITLRTTKMEITGPARGDKRMQTAFDKTGTEIIGTFQNCAGGITPWGTYLTCEENIDFGFGNINKADKNHPEIKKMFRFGLGDWNDGIHNYHERFDVSKHPTEINRFGWVVEIDPYDPHSTPRKRTALGRFKHEGCTTTIDKSGHIVAYMGDDQAFEYIYKFVSKDKFIKGNRKHNIELLTEGTLYVAKFNDNQTFEWLPLIYGKNGLTAENGFHSQADVMIDARLAADKVGATPLDRPEDVEIHPFNGKVYVSLTKNPARAKLDKANPRPHNMHGHILELTTGHDHIAVSGTWDILLMGEKEGLSCPDNLAFDGFGRLWVATDQGTEWSEISNHGDGIYGVSTEGENRGKASLFFRSPVGAETTGLCITPDNKTFFLSVQHPSSDGTENWKPFGRPSSFEDPATRWPDFNPNLPPRPSVVQIYRKGKTI